MYLLNINKIKKIYKDEIIALILVLLGLILSIYSYCKVEKGYIVGIILCGYIFVAGVIKLIIKIKKNGFYEKDNNTNNENQTK